MGKFLIRFMDSGGLTFCLKAVNGQIIAVSRPYKSEASCKKGIAAVISNAAAAGVENQTVEGYEPVAYPKFEIYADRPGEYRFRLKAKNGQIILTSEGYKKLASCLNGIESVKKNVVGAKLENEE